MDDTIVEQRSGGRPGSQLESLTGGWSTTAVGPGTSFRSDKSDLYDETQRRCDFDVVDASAMTGALFQREYFLPLLAAACPLPFDTLSPDSDVILPSKQLRCSRRMMNRYLSRRRPVLIRRAVQSWQEHGLWSRGNLSKLLREKGVSLSADQVPYAQHYGLSTDAPIGIDGYLALMDAYDNRLQAAMHQVTPTSQEIEKTKSCLGMPAYLVRNSSALEALELPRYVFDGQIEGKIPFSETFFRPSVPRWVHSSNTAPLLPCRTSSPNYHWYWLMNAATLPVTTRCSRNLVLGLH